MTERTSIFDTPGKTALDTSDFAPRTQPDQRPRPEEIDAASAGSRFQSREPNSKPVVDKEKTRRQPMTYRTGRSHTFSVKTTTETIDQFYAIVEKKGWKVAEAFENAVAILMRETSG